MDKPKRGRPPAAKAADGSPESTSLWPKLSVTLRPDLRAQLTAYATMTGKSQWEIVDAALKEYLAKHVKPEDRRMLDTLARRIAGQ